MRDDFFKDKRIKRFGTKANNMIYTMKFIRMHWLADDNREITYPDNDIVTGLSLDLKLHKEDIIYMLSYLEKVKFIKVYDTKIIMLDNDIISIEF